MNGIPIAIISSEEISDLTEVTDALQSSTILVKDNVLYIIDDTNDTICGCTKAGMLGGDRNPCYECGHPNGSHNMGKGCRIAYLREHKGFFLQDPNVDYSKYKRLMN